MTRRSLLVLVLTLAACGDDGPADRADAAALDAGPEDAAAPDFGTCELDPPYPARAPVPLPAAYDRDAVLDAFRDGADDMAIDEGVFDFFFIEDCEGLPTCWGNNPVSPYGLLMVPPAPGAAPIAVPGASAALTRGDSQAVFRLRADEVIVLALRTPPTAAYFGFTPYLFERDGEPYFASLGDTANHLTLATASEGATAFDAETLILLGADAERLAATRRDLASAGAAEGMIQEIRLPTITAEGETLFRPGLDETGDVAMLLFRVALFEDPAAGEAWLADAPHRVLRVRPLEPVSTGALAPEPLRPGGSACTEDPLASAVTALGRGVRERLTQDGRRASDMSTIPAPLDGFRCIAGAGALGTNCLGDNRDTTYLVNFEPVLLGEAEDLVVYGVRHDLTGKATYLAVAVVDSDTLTGIGGVAGAELDGSTAPYLDEPDDRLFAVRVTRGECDPGEACVHVPSEGFPAIPLAHAIRLITRPYLDPATATSPDPSELVLPHWVHVR